MAARRTQQHFGARRMHHVDSGPCELQEGGKYQLNNHLRFNILFHRDEETDLARIVGFEVD